MRRKIKEKEEKSRVKILRKKNHQKEMSILIDLVMEGKKDPKDLSNAEFHELHVFVDEKDEEVKHALVDKAETFTG